MSYQDVYLIVLADSAEEARGEAESWLDEYNGREYYDSFRVEEDCESAPLSEIRGKLEALVKDHNGRIIPELEKEIEDCRKYGYGKDLLGNAYVRLGDVLREGFCSDMPVYNMENFDWSVPAEDAGVERKAGGVEWYAVKVEIHS